MKPRDWRLADHLTALLLVAMLVSFALAGGALLLYRMPEIERQGQAQLQREVAGMAARLGLLPQVLQGQLAQADMLLDQVPAGQADSMLDASIDNARVAVAMYRLGADGRIEHLGLPHAQRGQRAALIGRDLSRSRLFTALPGAFGLAWDGRHPSPVNGAPTLAAALRDGQGRVTVVELRAAALVRTAGLAAGVDTAPMWVVDAGGEVIVDTLADGAAKPNLQAWLQAAAVAPAAPVLHWDSGTWLAAVAAVPELGWRIVGRMPAGLDHPQMRLLLTYNGLALVASLLAAIVVALLWARRMARPLQQTLARARLAMAGELPLAPAQRSKVVEFNQLAQEIEAMAVALHERELRWQSIFDAAPLAMAVSDTGNAMRLLAVNDAWCRDFGFAREEALGRSGVELAMVADPPSQEAMAAIVAAGPAQTELPLLRRDRQEMPTMVFGPHPVPGAEREVIWASMDIGPLRQAEQAVRELNQQLEARVAQRTEALAGTHAALTRTVEQLHLAQAELVHAEKMAALGALVAGIAHELQTPLGNSLLALDSLAQVHEGFQQASQAGLRRADLQTFLDGVEEGAEIAVRSLRRAAELVQNFKQVAVDQTSAQRRRFELHEVVRDMAASLRPGLAGTPYTIEVAVPQAGLSLDSYPGALGQALGQLIQNAVLHGFAGRDHGCVRITGGRGGDGQLWLRVADDGHGIAADRLGRIFEPFSATRAGREGAGLGLHISANAVANLLGGSLTVQSTAGAGSSFELRLPEEAPRPRDDEAP